MGGSTRKARLYAVLAGIAALGFTGLSQATERWAADGTLRLVYPQGDGSFVIALTTGPAQCLSTANPKYLHVVPGQNGVTADGVKALLASSLAAMAMGKLINVAFDDSTAYCYVNRIVVIN